MATPSCILAWKILWTEESGGLQSLGSQKSQTLLCTCIHTRTHTTNNLRRCIKQRHPTIPGNSVLLASNYRPALLSNNFYFLAQLTDFLPSFTSTLIK